MLIIKNLKIPNEVPDTLALSGIKYRDNTNDNFNDYQHINDSYITGNVVRVASVNLPTFVEASMPVVNTEKSIARSWPSLTSVLPNRSTFKVPLPIHINRLLQVVLVVLCGLAILCYSVDVIISNDVMLRQDKARRLSEQNAELSARLLKSVSFQGIQQSVLGKKTGPVNLHIADEVLIAKEVAPAEISPFKPIKHRLPLMSGY